MSLKQRMKTLFEIPGSSNRSLPMEGMRGLAALLVFFVHFDTLFGRWAPKSSIVEFLSRFSGAFGHTGVDIFFVLSGFLIYGITVKKKPSYHEFILRRIQRLFPVFLTVLGFYQVLSILFPHLSKIPKTAGHAFVYILANIAMLPGIVRMEPIIIVAWSLSYELAFYLSIPILIHCLHMRKWTTSHRVGFFLILSAGFTILYASGVVHHHRLILFGAGIILWELVQETTFPSILKSRGEIIAIICFLANLAVIGIYGMQTMNTQLVLSTTRWWYGAGLFVTAFWFSSFALAFNGHLKTLFSWSPLRWLGNMSYSYYLIHGVTLQGLRLCVQYLSPSHSHSSVFFIFLLFMGMLVTLLTSSALFLLIEKPFSLSSKRAIQAFTSGKIDKAGTEGSSGCNALSKNEIT